MNAVNINIVGICDRMIERIGNLAAIIKIGGVQL